MEYFKVPVDTKTAVTHGVAKTALYAIAKFIMTSRLISVRHAVNTLISTSLSNYVYLNYVDITKFPSAGGITAEVPIRAGLDTVVHNASEMVVGGSESWKQSLVSYAIVEVAVKLWQSSGY
jgi:hypothetical protein